MWVCTESLQSCPTLCYPMDSSPVRLLCPWDSPGKKMEWVAILSCRGSSPPRDQTWVSCIAGRLFYCLYHQGSYFATRQYLQNCSNNTKKPELMLEIFFLNQITKIADYDRRLFFHLTIQISCLISNIDIRHQEMHFHHGREISVYRLWTLLVWFSKFVF